MGRECFQRGKTHDLPVPYSVPCYPAAAQAGCDRDGGSEPSQSVTACEIRHVLAQGASHVSGEELPQLRAVKQRPGTVQIQV